MSPFEAALTIFEMVGDNADYFCALVWDVSTNREEQAMGSS